MAKSPKNSVAFSYQRELAVVLAIGFGVFYYIALFSFHPFDGSIFSASTPKIPIKNFGGSAGAFLAATAFYYFGILSFLLMLPVIYASFHFESKREALAKIGKIFAGWATFGLVLAVICTTFLNTVAIHSIDIPSAGIVGVEAAKFLFNIFGSFGVWIFLATVLLVLLVLFRRVAISKNVLKAQEESYNRLKSMSVSVGSSVRSSVATKVEQGKASLAAFRAKNDPYQVVKSPSILNSGRSCAEWREPQKPAILPTANHIEAVDTSPGAHLIPTVEAAKKLDFPSALDAENVATELSSEASGTTILLDKEQEAQLENIDKDLYEKPSSAFFVQSKNLELSQEQERKLRETGDLLVKTFIEFGVKGSVIAIQPGPVVTVFEFRPEAGVKQSKIQGLVDDLALALRVQSVFIEPVMGKRALGIQVPNQDRQMVHFGDVVSDESFLASTEPLAFAVGKSIDGSPVCTNLSKMPHLLIAGATGAGKSVAINTFICSVILKSPPEEVRMILVDPKMLELSVYEGIPHLLMPVVTESKRAAAVLKWAVHEMEMRYLIMQQAKVRSIAGFNKFWSAASKDQKTQILDKLEDIDKNAYDALNRIEDKLPYILIIIDELADLMLTAPKEVESLIQRLAQKARASGIHMVLATQRPSVDVITGVIKANLPCRTALQVVSKHDSRTILDQIGAERLLGKGDMLLQRPGAGRLERIQGAFVSDDEVVQFVEDVKKKNAKLSYDAAVMDWVESNREDKSQGPVKDSDLDSKYEESCDIAARQGTISASFLQRQLKVGYNRAARIVDQMESRGLISPPDGSKPRTWLGSSEI